MKERPMPFPSISNGSEKSDNPAIILFGNRFIAEQSPLELLVELLLVASSPKKLGNSAETTEAFPSVKQIRNWAKQKNMGPLSYAPKTRLCLKLFAFLGSSSIETRHPSHQAKYRELLKALAEKIESNEFDKTEILQSMENLFLGFLGAGLNRTWCTQTFFPVALEMLGSEVLWENAKAKRSNIHLWDEALRLFSSNKHIFLARGGELLYLQICNALVKGKISELNEHYALGFNYEEIDPENLRSILASGFRRVIGSCPAGLGELAEWIDQADGFTAGYTDRSRDEQRFAKAGWCPRESWPEASLFAVELARLCSVGIDPIERIELLTLACVFHVLRSLCAQSIRYSAEVNERRNLGSATGYAWIVGPVRTEDRVIRDLSHRCLVRVQDIIRTALRNKSIATSIPPALLEKRYNEADRRYGHKLFLSLSKKIGLVIPQRGPGARFVLSDRILRFLVMALVRPGDRCTLETFKRRLYAHFGIAVDGDEISRACQWADIPVPTTTRQPGGRWFESMLRQAGFLIELSDAISLVQNPFQFLLTEKG
ncbi:MAG: hypothetical protein J7M32_01525 [Deltaproteobacteria bacterium]|nr:hypothetical protein [Deltaproteobacteria bacterium]